MTGRHPTLRKAQLSNRAHDGVHRSTCGNCPSGCGVKVFERAGRLVDIFGDEEHPANKGSFCPKGLLAYFHQASPARITMPLVRARLTDPFRQSSWEEAVGIVAEHVAAARASDAAVGIHAGPAATFGHLLGGTRFAAAMGSSLGPWRYLAHRTSAGGPLVDAIGIGAQQLTMSTPRDWCNSRCIVVLGCDPAASDPMAMLPIVDARDRGTSIVTIDTRTTMTAQKSSYALRPRPGTLATLLRGILHLLIEARHIDQPFIDEATEGFDELCAEVAASTPAHTAEHCGLEEAELRKIATVIGAAWPVQVVTGGWLGLEELTGEDLRLALMLVAVRGSIGVPGGGLNVLATTPFDPVEWLEAGERALAEGPPVTLDRALAGAAPGGAWLFEGDPVARLSGGKGSLEHLERARFVAVLGAYRSRTTEVAHVVLPVASWLESDGLLAAGNGRALQWHRRVLAPPAECRTPLELWTELADRCGVRDAMPWAGAEPAVRARVAADWALARCPLTRALRVDALDPEPNGPGGVLWPCTEAEDLSFEASRFIRGDVRGRNILFQRPATYPGSRHRFPTPIGRIRLGAGPAVAPPEPRGGTHLAMVASPTVDHVEAYSGALSDRREPATDFVAHVHPATARSLGLADRGRATMENARGRLAVRVRVSDAVAPDVVWCLMPPGSRDGDAPGLTPYALYPETPDGGGIRASYAEVVLRAAG